MDISKAILIPESKGNCSIRLGNFNEVMKGFSSARREVLFGVVVVILQEALFGAGSAFSRLVLRVDLNLLGADHTGSRNGLGCRSSRLDFRHLFITIEIRSRRRLGILGLR